MNRDIYELIEKMIDKKVKGADTYINNGSRWLIFTDEKKWIFELTKEGTLWYNYYFFERIFKLISLNVVENQHHITKWVENFIQNGVKHTLHETIPDSFLIEDTIQNGVKHTTFLAGKHHLQVDDTIQNGVKHTEWCQIGTSTSIEDTIQNGVKHTAPGTPSRRNPIEDTIQNGVKETFLVEGTRIGIVENTIQIGVKDTHAGALKDETTVEDTIKNGIKETKHNPFEDGLAMEEAIQNGVKEIKEISDSSLSSEIFKVRCKQTIRDGIKETNLEDHHRLREVVQTVKNGIKETTPGGYLGSVEMKGKTVHQFEHSKQDNDVEDVIESGIKETESIASHRTWKSEEVIQNGVKETNPHFLEILNPINFEPVIKEMKRMNEVNIVLEEGIKEVRPLPSQEGNKDWGDYYYRQADRIKSHIKYVDDAIRDGIKETKYCELHSLMRADHIIRDGVKETWGYEKQPQVRVNEVINKGEKTIWNNNTTKL